jgi:hypothetical protein
MVWCKGIGFSFCLLDSRLNTVFDLGHCFQIAWNGMGLKEKLYGLQEIILINL